MQNVPPLYLFRSALLRVRRVLDLGLGAHDLEKALPPAGAASSGPSPGWYTTNGFRSFSTTSFSMRLPPRKM